MTGDGEPVTIIGSGPAGLAAAQALAKRNIEYVILEKDSAVGCALRRADPEMKLLSPKGLSLMPDMHPEPNAPTYLPFRVLVHELERYQRQHNLKVKLDCTVLGIRKDGRGFAVSYQAGDGETHQLRGSHVINATGIISQPRLPDNFHLKRGVGGTALTRVGRSRRGAHASRGRWWRIGSGGA
jgi:cation diffusion facilitator CzcD-associated flavoprotein CzcO